MNNIPNVYFLDSSIIIISRLLQGKLARQKYDEQAAKAVTGPLKDLDYEDDAGGGAGTYKLQHDTGKNLKTVVVYPKVEGSSGDVAGAEMSNLSIGERSLVPEGTPEHKIAFAPDDVFVKMVATMCPSWSQKRGCMTAIENLSTTIQGLDEKLMTGTPLSDSEQDFYDSVSARSLANKASKVKDLMHSHVESSLLTASEKAFLLDQVSDRIEHIRGELKEAEDANKSKRVENLTKNLEKAQERKEMISKITPKRLPPLKNERQIADLRTELQPLLQLEATAKGRLLSPKEATALARKEQIEAEIVELEVSLAQDHGSYESLSYTHTSHALFLPCRIRVVDGLKAMKISTLVSRLPQLPPNPTSHRKKLWPSPLHPVVVELRG